MSDSHIEIRGSYQYATTDALESALAAAHACIDEIVQPDIYWRDCFWRDGTTLHINARLPEDFDRLDAVAVLQALATTATHGAVETRCAGQPLEYYFVENDASSIGSAG